jgi:hypothetical protein
MRPRFWLAVVTAALVATLAPTVRAYDDDDGNEPAPTEPERPARPSRPRDPSLPYVFEIGVRSGYTTVPIRGGVNPFGLGFGGRFGFNVSGFYLGASMMDFMGGSDVGATDQAWLFGGDFGYSLRVGPYLTIRPQLGVGDVLLLHTEPATPGRGPADVITSASGTVIGGGGGGSAGSPGVTTSVNNIYLQPGITLLLATSHYFFGMNVSSLLVPGILYGPPPAQTTTWISYSAEGQAGFRF